MFIFLVISIAHVVETLFDIYRWYKRYCLISDFHWTVVYFNFPSKNRLISHSSTENLFIISLRIENLFSLWKVVYLHTFHHKNCLSPQCSPKKLLISIETNKSLSIWYSYESRRVSNIRGAWNIDIIEIRLCVLANVNFIKFHHKTQHNKQTKSKKCQFTAKQ